MSLRSTIIGSTMLVVLLTAGAAQSLSGSNTVYTDDIVDKNVTNVDLGTNSVTSSKVAPNSLTGSDVNESTLALPKVYATAVSATGVKLLGPGTASKSNTGTYDVDYGFALTNCTAQATAGANDSTNFVSYTFTANAAAFVGYPSSTKVHVYTNNAGTALDSAFMLTVICP